MPTIDSMATIWLEGGFSWAEARASKQKCSLPEYNHANGRLISIKGHSELRRGDFFYSWQWQTGLFEMIQGSWWSWGSCIFQMADCQHSHATCPCMPGSLIAWHGHSCSERWLLCPSLQQGQTFLSVTNNRMLQRGSYMTCVTIPSKLPSGWLFLPKVHAWGALGQLVKVQLTSNFLCGGTHRRDYIKTGKRLQESILSSSSLCRPVPDMWVEKPLRCDCHLIRGPDPELLTWAAPGEDMWSLLF